MDKSQNPENNYTDVVTVVAMHGEISYAFTAFILLSDKSVMKT